MTRNAVDFRPRIRRDEPAAAAAPVPVAREMPPVAFKQDAVRPRAWEFVPERDANGLITRIIATPID